MLSKSHNRMILTKLLFPSSRRLGRSSFELFFFAFVLCHTRFALEILAETLICHFAIGKGTKRDPFKGRVSIGEECLEEEAF